MFLKFQFFVSLSSPENQFIFTYVLPYQHGVAQANFKGFIDKINIH